MTSTPIVALITAPSEEVGREIAGALLEKKLAACVNILPGLRSLYKWKGETCDDAEVLLIAKTRAEVFQEGFVPVVRAVHPYEVPEIIALPITMGLQSYLDWIGEETAP
jgi:periplasmic divalent cation tolerance protein